MLKVVPSDPRWDEAAHAMNARLAAGGSRHRFYPEHTLDWLNPEPGATVWRERYLLADEETGQVRGGYVIKFETFLFNGEPKLLGSLQGPIAESIVDPTLKGIGGQMMKDARARCESRFSWGANSFFAPSVGEASIQIRVVNAGRFLRRAPAVRTGKLRLMADIGAVTGLGALGLHAAQAMSRVGAALHLPCEATEQPEFGPWADEVWDKAKAIYKLVAVRDAKTLNRLLTVGSWPEPTILKVTSAGRVVGWAAVRYRKLEGDSLFGDLRAGSILDALALPGYEASVAQVATKHLLKRGVDLLGACFLHPAWINGLRASGYLPIPKRRNVGFTPDLVEAAGGVDVLMRSTHFTLMDTDGPRIF